MKWFCLLFFVFASSCFAGKFFPGTDFDEVRVFLYNLENEIDGRNDVPFLNREGTPHHSNVTGDGIVLSPEQQTRLLRALRHGKDFESALCYQPHHAFVFYRGGKPVAAAELCLMCAGSRYRPNHGGTPDFKALSQLVAELGLPDFDHPDKWEAFAKALENPPKKAFTEDFAKPEQGAAKQLASNPFITWHKKAGQDGAGLRVRYEGYERGSRRVISNLPLGESADVAVLEYDVFFERDFQFVKGGKLHGLGPKNPATGGAKVGKDNWSARLMFGPEGRVKTYNYTQTLRGNFGEGVVAPDFAFKRGQWYRIAHAVKLNTPGEDDGEVRLSVDGRLIAWETKLTFRKVGTPDSAIQHLLFSTFHGGQSRDWAPRKAGSFATVHARFDNIDVHLGHRKVYSSAIGKQDDR